MPGQADKGEDPRNEPFGITPPSPSLPKGGGAIRGIGEKFGANPVTGTGSMTVPIATSPGRAGFGPQLSLAYNSGSGNGPFGFGWSLSLPFITRKTDKGLPRYREADKSDVFILSGADDLVPAPKPANVSDPAGYAIEWYRPRVEGRFARIERWTADGTGEIHWRSISRDNVTTLYGETNESRIFDPADPDPVHPSRIFSWLICQSYDDKGNAIVYNYTSEDSQGADLGDANERNRTPDIRATNRYLKRVRYGNTVSRLLPAFVNTEWLFEVVFDYGEGHLEVEPPNPDGRQTVRAHLGEVHAWPVRPDPFSSYRSTFEVRTYRLCERVLMFHHFGRELGVDDYLVRSTEFAYDRDSIASFLTSVTQSGYVAWPDAGRPTDLFLQRSLPPVEFEYSKAVLSEEVKEIDRDSLENVPGGLDGGRYQWVDLDGEGVSGILTGQASGWFYKRNIGEGRFGPIEQVARMPVAAHPGAGGQQLLDLAGDGQLNLTEFAGATPGFYKRTTDEGWDAFTPFRSLPRINWADPNLRFVDLTGDGHTDVLIAEDCAFRWHRSLAEDGFGPEERNVQPFDEEQGPRLVLADGTQSIYLADLSGDGLSDLVRIRNGEVSYWPNLGYGRFGVMVTMDDSPWFDHPDVFDPRQIRLADIDGSGTTDIMYLQRGLVTIYRNLSGNGWSEAETLDSFPLVDDLSTVLVIDLLGTGTACLVWASPLPGDSRQPMRYVDLMAEGKPHLLTVTRNNLGAETRVRYAASTSFYLADRAAGRPWITKLPFPVHVVERVETWDWISRNRFVSTYTYHHGYFDGVEREFRGFGMVEQQDTEEFASLSASDDFPTGDNIDAASHVPPVLTKTWFHTGVYIGRDRVSNFFAGLLDAQDRGEYYREPAWRDDDVEARKRLLDDTVLPAGLTAEEEREACRSLKGAMLRQEVYALDGTDKAEEPYVVTEQNFTIRCLQPRGGERYAVFFTHAREAISYHYERNPVDPRTSHALTLEVDSFGNVLKSASVAYGRRNADPEMVLNDQKKQTQILVTYIENRYTNALDTAVAYRTPAACENCTYALTGYLPTGGVGRFQMSDFVKPDPGDSTKLIHVFDSEIGYDDTPGAGKERRPVKRLRTYYRPDDLGVSRGDPLALLTLGTLEALALPGESYKLAFTAPLAKRVFLDSGKLPTQADLDALLAGEGKYTHGEADADWWIPSGRVYGSPDAGDSAATELAEAGEHFFLPRRYRDPFGHDTLVTYDRPADLSARRYDLLVTTTSDALSNTITAANDYRVLQPALVTDPNGNRTVAAFDALGMVVATAVRGKAGENFGDVLNGFDADPSLAALQGFIADPRAAAASLLGNATTRIVYDLARYQRAGQPPFAATLARETHVHDSGGTESKIQINFGYSDGYGREIQKKSQAEAGDAPQREAPPSLPGGDVGAGELMRDDQGKLIMARTPFRWVGSGRAVFNNKGKPVRQYEPFFSSTHLFEPEREITDTGVSPELFYDPLDRVVATLHPNDTYEKVVFDPWQQTTYDVNDTVTASGAQTGDPRTDPDIAGYVTEYFTTQPANWQTWYAQRIGNPVGDPELDAAQKAAAHADTPSVAHFDALGRPFLTIAHNKFQQNGAIVDEKYPTRVELDIQGNQRSVTDAKDRVVMRYDHDMLSQRIHQASMEAGERWMLNEATGKPIRAWDSRGFERRMTYDELRRATGLYVTERPTVPPAGPVVNPAERLAEQTVYGESQGDAHNHRTRVYQVFDAAGIVTSVAYDFKGNLLEGLRELRPYDIAVDWLTDTSADDGRFPGYATYDALNRPLTATSPDGSIYRPTFNEANLLEKVDVNLRGAAATAFVTNIDYDAKGQRERIEYGNGAETTYEYDPLTFRLTHLTTTRPSTPNTTASQLFVSASVVQDLHYTYDPVGNLTRIEDAALQTVFHTVQIDPVGRYTYDATYRLIEAEGREHIGQMAFDFNPPNGDYRDYPFMGNKANSNDLQALRTYTEQYEYDAVGNFETLRHVASGGNWTRTYDCEEDSLIEAGKSNRLTRTTVGNGFKHVEPYMHDAHGNITAMPHLPVMAWDFKDQFQQAGLGGGGNAFYIYDSAGQRVRKVIESQNGTRQKERIYLGGFEVYREYSGNGTSVALERESLHVMDDKQRIALVETQTIQSSSRVKSPTPLQRLQLGNHLGSASVELDDAGALVSYEEYHPYGTTAFQGGRSATEVSARRYRYTGKERDEESGLCYHGARYYVSDLGRWANADRAGLVDGPNLYAYVKNNPIRFADSTGMQIDGEVNFSSGGPIRRVALAPHVDEAIAVRGDLAGGTAGSPSDPLNKQFLDPRTNSQSKSNFVSSAPANPRPNVSIADSPEVAGNRIVSGRFSEVDELRALADDATARTTPGLRTNATLRASMKADPAVRTALSSVGVNPDTLTLENPAGVPQFPTKGTVNLSPVDADLNPATGEVTAGPNTSAVQARQAASLTSSSGATPGEPAVVPSEPAVVPSEPSLAPGEPVVAPGSVPSGGVTVASASGALGSTLFGFGVVVNLLQAIEFGRQMEKLASDGYMSFGGFIFAKEGTFVPLPVGTKVEVIDRNGTSHIEVMTPMGIYGVNYL